MNKLDETACIIDKCSICCKNLSQPTVKSGCDKTFHLGCYNNYIRIRKHCPGCLGRNDINLDGLQMEPSECRLCMTNLCTCINQNLCCCFKDLRENRDDRQCCYITSISTCLALLAVGVLVGFIYFVVYVSK